MKRSFWAIATSIAMLGSLTGVARASLLDGTVFEFDEFGNGIIDTNGVVTTMKSHLSADPTGGIVGSPVLIYDLGTAVGPGDVLFTEPGVVVAVQFTDMFRFYDDQDNQGHLIFYSDNVGGADSPADVGIPNSDTNLVFSESGVEGGFQWCTFTPEGGGVIYEGLSDGVLPEPASMTVLGLGVIALIRRRKSR